MNRRLLLVLLAVAGVLAWSVPGALADGDPASDYLLTQPTFLSPFDGKIPSADAKQLDALVLNAKAQGFPLKVAVIVTSYDLGSVPILFRKPQLYAKFLSEEDFYYWKSELLVVMPNGYGLYKDTAVPAADQAVLDKLPAVSSNDGATLVLAAERAVRALAAKRGLTLSASSGASGSSMLQEDLEIAGGAVVLLALGLGGRFFLRRRRR